MAGFVLRQKSANALQASREKTASPVNVLFVFYAQILISMFQPFANHHAKMGGYASLMEDANAQRALKGINAKKFESRSGF